MKKPRAVTFLLLFFLMFTVNIISAYSHDKSVLPYYIKIGLFFDGTEKSELMLESNTTFEAGIYNGDKFISLFNLDTNEITLRKDEFYIDKGLNPEKYTMPTNRPDNLPNTRDAYHIQIGQNSTNYIEAHNFLNSIDIRNTQTYLSYEDGWRIYAGPYANEFEAQEEARNINLDYRYETGIIKPSGTRVQVINERNNVIFIYDSSCEVYFMSRKVGKDDPVVNVGGISYRGGITAKRLTNSDMTIINKLPLEEYLYGVIPAEMYASWPMEALKAQAIAARGFAVTNFNKYKQFDFNLCTTTYSQVYKGYSGENPNTNIAVDETRNMVITYDNKLIEPYYHSDSGGYTENSENVWLNQLPYIRGVKDDFSSDTPYSTWSVSFTKEEIKNCLDDNNIFIGDILDIKVISVSDNGRILSLMVRGTKGQEILEKEKSRFVFGLRSSLFTVNSNNDDNDNIDNNYMELAVLSGTYSKPQSINLEGKYIIDSKGIHEIKNVEGISIYSGEQYKTVSRGGSIRRPTEGIVPPNVFVFDGKGYGHGLGMSQYGAKKMAELGYKYDEILTHYYTNTKVEQYGNKGF